MTQKLVVGVETSCDAPNCTARRGGGNWSVTFADPEDSTPDRHYCPQHRTHAEFDAALTGRLCYELDWAYQRIKLAPNVARSLSSIIRRALDALSGYEDDVALLVAEEVLKRILPGSWTESAS